MAHIKNDEFYLYTGLTANGNECFEAYSILTESGIPFRHLHYGDPKQHKELIDNIKTWFPGSDTEIKMPFVTYAKIYEFEDPAPRLPEIVVGIDNIRSTNWLEISNYQG